MPDNRPLNKALIPLIQDAFTKDTSFDFTIDDYTMRPFLKAGKTTVTLIKPICYKRYNLYLFIANDTLYLQRLVDIKEETFIFQADASKQKEKTTLHHIIAQVDAIKTNNKSINQESLIYRLKIRLWFLFRPCRKFLLLFFTKKSHKK